MITLIYAFALIWITCTAKVPRVLNETRTTISGIAAYRSVLTLDWLAAEDNRQRELVAAFETEASSPTRLITTECIAYPRPSAGKVARLMLELVKNLEGDDNMVITELIHALIKTKLLILETSSLETEPDFDALINTPGVMMGEPHITLPRVTAMVWMTVTDPSNTKKNGWCSVNQITKYLKIARPNDIAKTLHNLEPILARARFIMEDFIQHMTPLNMMPKTTTTREVKPKTPVSSTHTYKLKEVQPSKNPPSYDSLNASMGSLPETAVEGGEPQLSTSFITTSPGPDPVLPKIMPRVMESPLQDDMFLYHSRASAPVYTCLIYIAAFVL